MLDKEKEWLLQEKYDGVVSTEYGHDLERLAAGEPLAYVIGWVPFLNARIYLDSKPLIPRPETEWWTELLLKNIPQNTPVQILDLFAGSGCIGIALLKNHPLCHVTFGEKEIRYLATIQKNIEENEIDTVRTSVYQTDVFSNIHEKFDYITANPPYIPLEEKGISLPELAHEPQEALYAENHGLELIYRFLSEASHHLKPNGTIYMEFNEGQEQMIERHCKRLSLHAKVMRDQYGRMRLLVAQYVG